MASPGAGKHILVVDDERDLTSTIEYNLAREGFSTRTAHTAADALELARQSPRPDLVLLDLMLPDASGLEVCRKLKQDEATRNVPVVMLTAKGEEIDRVVGFEVGADDYVVKPFSVRELLLRIRAILKRAGAEEAGPQKPTSFGLIRVEPDAHRVWVADDEVHLTALEFKLLSTLLQRRGKVQSREKLLQDVWGIQAEVTTRTVDTHVKRLREKLGPAGAYVQTIRSVGYRFREHPDEEED